MITPYQIAKQIRTDISAKHDPSNPRDAIIQENARLLREMLVNSDPHDNLLYLPFLNAADAYRRHPNHREQVIKAAETAFAKIEKKHSQ